MLLQQFVRSFPIRACEVTRVARSMDENELEVEVCQMVKGKPHDFVFHFVGSRSRVEPWPKMKVNRISVFNETFELTDESGKVADVSYKECKVIYADDYEKAFGR